MKNLPPVPHSAYWFMGFDAILIIFLLYIWWTEFNFFL